eukprot:7608933-Pyramimonas_sp.AAC.1
MSVGSSPLAGRSFKSSKRPKAVDGTMADMVLDKIVQMRTMQQQLKLCHSKTVEQCKRLQDELKVSVWASIGGNRGIFVCSLVWGVECILAVIGTGGPPRKTK